MIEIWRLLRRSFSTTPRAAFDGDGAAIAGGRWNRKGTPVAYASWSRSLAVLEILATIDRADAPADYLFASASLEESDIDHVEQLPPDWRAPARSDATVGIGEHFVAERKTLALAVPSAIVPQELNYLINPSHPRFGKLRIGTIFEAFSFDERIFTRHVP